MDGQLVEVALVAAANVFLGSALLWFPDHPVAKFWAKSRHRRRWGIGFIVLGVLVLAGQLATM